MNKKTISNEHQLIFLCARLEMSSSTRQEIKKLISDSLIDWKKITAISAYHQIQPFFYYNMTKLNLQNVIPKNIFAEIKNCYYSNLNRNLMLEKEISLILELTNRSNINIIPLKGFSLLQTLYCNPAIRIMVDIDILIKEKDFQKVKDILAQLNYRENVNETSQEYYQKYRYDIVFTKTHPSSLSPIIEIHFALAPPRPFKANFPHLRERAQEKVINNQKLLCLSPEDTFLSLSLHIRRHTRRLTLKFIVDIAELLNLDGNNLDWHYIKKSAKKNRITTLIYFSLYLAKELLKAAVSQEILNEFSPNSIKSAFLHLSINKYNFFALKKQKGAFLRFLLFDNSIDFLIYLWRTSFLEKFIAKRYFKKDKKSLAS